MIVTVPLPASGWVTDEIVSVSLASTLVSLASTFTLWFDAVVTVSTSATATGASLTEVTVMVAVPVAVPPLLLRTV